MSDAAISAYRELENRFGRRSAILDAAGMLEWDFSTIMPEGGRMRAAGRSWRCSASPTTC